MVNHWLLKPCRSLAWIQFLVTASFFKFASLITVTSNTKSSPDGTQFILTYIYVSHAIKPDQPTISYTPYCVRVGLERNLSKLSFASSTAIHDYSSHAKVRSMSWK